MANPNGNLGTKLETEIKTWLRAHGWRWADRIPRRGSADEGDVRLSERVPFIIEAKSAKRTTDRAAIGTWLRELESEVSHSKSEAGAVVHKKRGTIDVGEYVAIMPVKYLNHLLKKAYGEDFEAVPTRRRRRVIPPYRD